MSAARRESRALPLTQPADVERRFNGLARLYGIAGAKKIREAHVVVVGLGGVGSWAAEALGRSGVARLTLIDLDHIAESNINRQIHALGSTLGQAKVQAMRDRIADINPMCEVRTVEEFVDSINWPGIAGFKGACSGSVCVIDACDQIKAKTAMAAWALVQQGDKKSGAGVYFVSVGAAGGKRQAHKVDIDDLAMVTHDPLLAQMRYRLRRQHGAAGKGLIGLACVFSREAVMRPVAGSATPGDAPTSASASTGANAGDDIPGAAPSDQQDSSLNCHGYGSIVSVTATFGICAAGWVLGKIAGQ